jgi:hypothetical protein
MLLFALLAVPAFGLTADPPPAALASANQPADDNGRAARTVYVAGGLSDEQLIQLTANLAACGLPGVLLIDSHQADAQQRHFLAAYRPDRVIPIGSFPDGVADLERRLGVKIGQVVPWQRGQPANLWKAFFPHADRVVVCPAEPPRLLLQAACLAGSLGAPLYTVTGQAADTAAFKRWLTSWQTGTVYVVGDAAAMWKRNARVAGAETSKPRSSGHKPEALAKGESHPSLAPQASIGIRVVRLKDERAVATRYLSQLRRTGPVQALVVTNPADRERKCSPVSPLAASVALRRHAALLSTDPDGKNAAALVAAAGRQPALRRADALLFLADLQAIPMERRPNPVKGGKEKFIEMEPLTPTGSAAFSFATGRLFHADPGMVALVLARQQLLAERPAQRKALVVSNATGTLPLLEAFSRNTVKELRNRGYETTALFGKDTDKDDVRRLLPENDIFLWEGHYTTLVKDYGLPGWTEPLPPALVVLQSCLALSEEKAMPLLDRGGVGVVGSPNRIYSGSGGAFTLAFFDALLYDQQTLGSSLRHAKNFLLAYSLLKEKRLGGQAKLSAADVRAAWEFTLWGDPTLRLPAPAAPDDALPAVRHAVHGNTITMELPREPHDKAVTAKYSAQILPNGRLAGLVGKAPDGDCKRMLSLVFAEVRLPHAMSGKTPRLHSRLPSSRYVFCWDERRRTGYLLLTPRTGDQGELRFHVTWESGPERHAAVRATERARPAAGTTPERGASAP